MISWDSLKDMVASAAPVLGSLLGGPAGGAAGALIAKAFGANADPKSILEAMQKDQEWVFKLQELEKTHERELLALQLNAATAELNAARDVVLAVNASMQSESKSEDSWQRRWRPFIGFVFGGAFAVVTSFVCYLMYLAVFEKNHEAMREIPNLVDTFTMLFGIPGAILGVTAWGRNKLKIQRETK